MEISDEIIDIWSKASLPCVTKNIVYKIILDYHDKYRMLIKQIKGRKNSVFFIERLNKFTENSKKYI